MVKADGYGLGAAKVSAALFGAGCRRYFVATIDEGIQLRETLPADGRIYVLDGLMGDGTTDLFDHHGLIPVLNSPGDIERWSNHARTNGGRSAILALDTGMSRLGLTRREAETLAQTPSALDGIGLEYVMSHLACAEEAGNPMNDRQRQSFDDIRTRLPTAKASLANSGGIFLGSGFHYDLARPGAALYGVSRSTGAPKKMKQPVVLKAKILQVRVVDTESTVGYGATRKVYPGTRLATVAAGYADGYLRCLGNRSHGFIGDIRVPVAGRISMDLIVFDISDVPNGKTCPGDDIVLIDDRQTVDDLAEEAGTIGYEILTSLGSRYARLYSGADA